MRQNGKSAIRKVKNTNGVQGMVRAQVEEENPDNLVGKHFFFFKEG